MKERPILFSTPMVKAVQDGRKTHTRRIIKYPSDLIGELCPYGQLGDFIYVRETHYLYGKWFKNGISKTGKQKWTFEAANREVRYFDNPPDIIRRNSYRELGWYKRPAIFMPRWASRITLQIKDIRAERVQDISEADALDEGIDTESETYAIAEYNQNMGVRGCGNVVYSRSYYPSICCFAELWDSINAKRGYSWGDNPWVWVIEFKKV